MSAITVILLLGVAIGVILALTGAGGGILAVPALVFGTHASVAEAGPVGLLAVGLAAALGAALGLRAGTVRYKAALLIAAAGIVCSPFGLWLAQRTPNRPLSIVFAGVLLFVAWRMWQRACVNAAQLAGRDGAECGEGSAGDGDGGKLNAGSNSGGDVGSAGNADIGSGIGCGGGIGRGSDIGHGGDIGRGRRTAYATAATGPARADSRPPPPCRLAANGKLIWTAPCARALALSGMVAGGLSGLLGVGGGFVMIPALQRFTDLNPQSVVATSLAVIALVSTSGVAVSAASGHLPWLVALPFSAGALAGMMGGRMLAARLAGPRLQQGFALLAAAVAAIMLAKAAL